MISPHDSMSGIVDDARGRFPVPPEPKRCSKIAQMIVASFPVFVMFATGIGFIISAWAGEGDGEPSDVVDTALLFALFALMLVFWAVLVWSSVSQASINSGLRLLTKFFIASAIPLEGVALWAWLYIPDPPDSIFPMWLVTVFATVVTVQMVFFGVKFHIKLSRDIYLEKYGEYDPTEVSRKTRMLAMFLVMLGIGGIGGMHRVYVGRYASGFLMLLTLGGLWGWTFYDLLVMITGKFVDNDGRVLEKNIPIDWVVLVSAYFLAPSLGFFVLFWTWRLIF